jgi:hypothetical protein
MSNCHDCLFFEEQPGSFHGGCKNNYLKREDLTFVTKDAIKLFFKPDYSPEIIKTCKQFSKRPICIKCHRLFNGEIGSVMYAHFPDTEFEGICKECNGDAP